MDARLARLRETLASLAERSRFEMLVQLAGAERCVTELAADVGLSQSCTTRHLQALARAGLVRGRRDGRRVLFSAVRGHAELATLFATLARLGRAATPAVAARAAAPVPRAPRARAAAARPPARAHRPAAVAPAGARPAAPLPARAPRGLRSDGLAAAPPPRPATEPPAAVEPAAPPSPRRRDDLDDFLL